MRGPVHSPRATALLLALALLALGSAAAWAQDCNPGYYNPDNGQEPCLACTPGTQAPSYGSQSCEVCPEGTFSSTPASTACLTCPDGKIAPALGSTACLECPAGKTSDPTHTFCINVAPGVGPWAQGALAALILGTALVFVRRRRTA